jgi:hypothetical protein
MVAVVTAFLVTGCTERYSQDPEIALAQKWADGCHVTDRALRTGLTLGMTGNLSEPQLHVLDNLATVYEAACTTPPILGEDVASLAVRVAMEALCPGQTVHDPTDLVITALDAATCASAAALVFLEENE